jgi:hypothetical protein
MATLKKMTRMGADVRQIARLLQAKAPEGHMLAYITPEEAELLKSQGGSGKPHADTGVPSFEQDGSYGFSSADITPDYDIGNVRAEAPPPPTIASPPEFSANKPAASFDANQYAPPPSARTAEAAPAVSATRGLPQFNESFGTSYGPGYAAPTSSVIDTSRPSEDKGIMQRLTEATGMKEDTLARLGLGGLQAVLGARTARKAAEEGKVGKAEQQALAQPYQAKGAELQRAAQAGELTPVGQQQLQAVQAQAAQQATARGGVGTMQAQAQVEAFRQQLLQSQYDYGLKLSGIGDQIALGAIKTGMQADQYVNNLTNTYYGNIARTLYGAPPQAAQTQPTTGAQ